MPFYTRLGQIPHKRHTQFRKADGSLYREEVMQGLAADDAPTAAKP